MASTASKSRCVARRRPRAHMKVFKLCSDVSERSSSSSAAGCNVLTWWKNPSSGVTKSAPVIATLDGGYSQSPLQSSSINFLWNTLSALTAALSSLRVGFFVSCVCLSAGANLVSTPGNVGRKNGAFFGSFGGSFGLFRCCITSRLRRVCQRERGSRVNVINSPSSCGGVEKTSGGVSCTVTASSASKAKTGI